MSIVAKLPTFPRPVKTRFTSASAPAVTGVSERVSWKSPAQGLWVGETPSSYLGMVDRNHDGFVATSCSGADLGVFGTLEEAQLAVYTSWFLPKKRSLAARWAWRAARRNNS